MWNGVSLLKKYDLKLLLLITHFILSFSGPKPIYISVYATSLHLVQMFNELWSNSDGMHTMDLKGRNEEFTN